MPYSDEYTTPYRDERGKFAKRPGTEELTQIQTGEQQPGHRSANTPYIAGSFLYANGGNALNPMGFPGYGMLYGGNYINYRWMLQHPVLRLVRSIATADVLCNKWEYVGDDPEDVKLVRDMLDPIRSDLMNDFFTRGRDMGWQGGENVWEDRGVYTWLTRVKPLLVDVTEGLRDERGVFSGLVNRVPDSETNPKRPEVRIAAPFKAFKYTYDSEAGYIYGRSWLENVRMTAWRDWLDCAQQLQRLGAKITGVQLIMTSPAGTFPGPIDPGTGKAKQISYRETCEVIIKALANGAPGAWLPSLNLPVDVKGNLNTAKIIAELAQKSVISCELLDHGSTTPAIMGLLERMKHAEGLMFDGGMRPPAVGHGESGKANMEQKAEVGSKVSQLEDQDFARQCQPLVDAILVLNRGGNKRGAVRIVPPSIVDNKRAYTKAILLAAMNDPTIAREMLRVIDVNTELLNIDIRTKDTYSPDRIEKADKDAQKAKAAPSPGGANTNKKPDPQGGRPKKGEGNPKARPQKGRKAA